MESFLSAYDLILGIFIMFGIMTASVLVPMLINRIKFYMLVKLGKKNADSRDLKEILHEINWHDDELVKCRAELFQLFEIHKDDTDALLLAGSTPSEKPRTVAITYNSKEIGCRYQGIEAPKYIRNDQNHWYELEGVAHYDNENKAIVDDVDAHYVTIHDVESKHGFFYKQLEGIPVLNLEIEGDQAKTV